MRTVHLVIFLLCFKAVSAHTPDLASLMIYNQNGKSILVIKSALTAFEGEVDYIFGKDAYKTPEEFNQLVIQHFQKNCFVIANGDTLKFSNIQVQLGHETNLFAELDNMPETISTFQVSNTVFADMPNNLCEVILALDGFPQKQYVLSNANNHEAKLTVEGNQWVVDENPEAFDLAPGLLMGLAGLSIAAILGLAILRRKYKLAL